MFRGPNLTLTILKADSLSFVKTTQVGTMTTKVNTEILKICRRNVCPKVQLYYYTLTNACNESFKN